MNERTKKDFLKINHGLRAEFYVVCPQVRDNCRKCPFFVKDSEKFCTVNDDRNRKIMEKAWAENHGYIEDPYLPFCENDESINLPIKPTDPAEQINPSHYKNGEMQTIERMMTLFGPKKVKTFCEINALKYLDRAGYKGDALIDHQKADWYLRLANVLRYAETVPLGLELLEMFLKEEEEKNGRNSD